MRFSNKDAVSHGYESFTIKGVYAAWVIYWLLRRLTSRSFPEVYKTIVLDVEKCISL